MKQCNERVMQILRDTPPDGAQFAEGIEVSREKNKCLNYGFVEWVKTIQ